MTLNARSTVGKAVVIGAGTMGGGIAALLANVGWQVSLLDVAGEDANNRNVPAQKGLERLQQSKPPLLYLPEFADRIRVGNVEENLDWLSEADWVVEAVAEKLESKQAVMAQIEAHAGVQTVLSTNTSGLSLSAITEGRSEAFKRRFLGTHFFNPPRYLKLLELIVLPETEREVAQGFAAFAEAVLGRRVVEARDTPGFISNRVGMWTLLDTIHTALEQGLTVEEVDYLTGALLGRPRSATFRLADIIGFDIIADIARNQYRSLPDDPYHGRMILPDVLERLLAEGRLGEKTGSGFYQRAGADILVLDFASLTYRPRQEADFPEVEPLFKRPLAERLATIQQNDETRWGRFLNTLLNSLRTYVRQVGPEIAGDVLAIDRVMQWGFHWEVGPFALNDLRRTQNDTERHYSGIGLHRSIQVFGLPNRQPISPEPEVIILADLKANGKTVLETPEASLIDLGEDVLCLEYHTKMNTFSPALCTFLTQARERAEREFAALIIGNQGAHFSAGYNLNLFLEAIAKEDWAGIDRDLHEAQYAFMGLKYARVPVIIAPHGYTLGAGCESAIHCTAMQAAPELLMGLPETSIGVIPAGGGTKEMLARTLSTWDNSVDPYPLVERLFELILFPKPSGNALEAQKRGFLRPSDRISRNPDRQLFDAKQFALSLANSGYAPPPPKGIWVLGEDGLARLRMKLHQHYRAGVLSDHDRLIADRLAYCLSGGNLPYAQEISEDYLLTLEREVFVALCHEPKSADRMRHTLATGKPLKN